MIRVFAVVLAIMQFAFGSVVAELTPHSNPHDYSGGQPAAIASLGALEEPGDACGATNCEEPDSHSHCPALAGACGSAAYGLSTVECALCAEEAGARRILIAHSLDDGLAPETDPPPPRV